MMNGAVIVFRVTGSKLILNEREESHLANYIYTICIQEG